MVHHQVHRHRHRYNHHHHHHHNYLRYPFSTTTTSNSSSFFTHSHIHMIHFRCNYFTLLYCFRLHIKLRKKSWTMMIMKRMIIGTILLLSYCPLPVSSFFSIFFSFFLTQCAVVVVVVYCPRMIINI